MVQSAAIAVASLSPDLAEAQAPTPTIVGIPSRDGRVVLTNMGGSPSLTVAVAAEPAYASRYLDLIDTISRHHGIDPRLTHAVIEVESGFDPGVVSSRGALGLMQLIPETGRRFGVNNFFDPADNIRGGVQFLRFLIDKFDGNADLVLAAYNSGENRVERLGRVPQIPETVDYVRKVRAVYERLGGDLLSLVLPREDPKPDSTPIYRSVDDRGVLTFSSFGPNR
jgi:Transglycosylase SLT domain